MTFSWTHSSKRKVNELYTENVPFSGSFIKTILLYRCHAFLASRLKKSYVSKEYNETILCLYRTSKLSNMILLTVSAMLTGQFWYRNLYLSGVNRYSFPVPRKYSIYFWYERYGKVDLKAISCQKIVYAATWYYVEMYEQFETKHLSIVLIAFHILTTYSTIIRIYIFLSCYKIEVLRTLWR